MQKKITKVHALRNGKSEETKSDHSTDPVADGSRLKE